ncbi:MAG TPA: DUF1573 domain-containing protein [Candidatus Binataceae bacterium]|nr:DUF1573 domain-containing protein [Candidatus Binataceae bacterium]
MIKKTFFAIAIVFVTAAMPALSSAQDEPMIPGANSAPPGPQPKVLVENPLFDFGTATEATMVNHTFRLKNVGKGRLVITGVKTSCGCTAAKPDKNTLGPGEETEIAVGFDTHFQKGHQVRTITAMTNDPNTPQAIMTIQGVVKRQVSATPDDVAFGKVKQGTEVTKEVIISDLTNRKDPFTVSDVNNSNPAIKVEQLARPDGKPGALLKITLTKAMPAGSFDDTINMTTSRIPLKVDVFGQVTGDLSVAPAQVSFGIVPHGGEATRMVKLTNEGGKTVKVLSITSTAVPVSASAEPIDGSKDYKIIVQLHRGTPDGQVRGQLEIKTDDPEQQVLNVPFYGIVGQLSM